METEYLAVFKNRSTQVRIFGSSFAPLFAAVDVCKNLGIKNTSDAVSALDSDEVSTIALTDGRRRGARKLVAVTESGLYALIFKSRKASARTFRRWITSEVIPAIRRKGAYAMPGAQPVAAAQLQPMPASREVALPACPSVENLLARIFDAVLGNQSTCVVHARAIAQECWALGLLREVCKVPMNSQSVAGLMLLVRQVRRQSGGWFRTYSAGGPVHFYYCCEPTGQGRARRYLVQRKSSDWIEAAAPIAALDTAESSKEYPDVIAI